MECFAQHDDAAEAEYYEELRQETLDSILKDYKYVNYLQFQEEMQNSVKALNFYNANKNKYDLRSYDYFRRNFVDEKKDNEILIYFLLIFIVILIIAMSQKKEK